MSAKPKAEVISLAAVKKARAHRAKSGKHCDAGKLAAYYGRQANYYLRGGRKPAKVKYEVCARCASHLASILLNEAVECMDWARDMDQGA